MCRIAGIWDLGLKKAPNLKNTVIKMCDLLAYGGPDDAGLYIDRSLSLGHRRLSIIDLSEGGHQPMPNDDETIWITYNGELYNFQEIKKELQKKGYKFRSKSDTEVVLKSYEEWGIHATSKFIGMFSFVIWDKNKDKLILARDRFGIKPLYYAFKDKKFIFSSEVKAFKQFGFPVNKRALIQFLVFGYIPSQFTTLQGVFSLPPASIMQIKRDGSYKIYNYYKVNFEPKLIDSEEKIIKKTRKILEETVKIHLISDAPIGVFFSGGIDSTSLVALASIFKENLTTISVTFDEKEYSEKLYQQEVLNKFETKHYEVRIRGEDFYKELQNIFIAMDQPTIDGVNTFFISKAAKSVGLKTVLSGLGGDEIFYGYSYFHFYKRLKKLSSSPILKTMLYSGSSFLPSRFRKLSFLNTTPLDLYLCMRGIFTPKEIASVLKCEIKEIYSNLDFNVPKLDNLSVEDEYAKLELNYYLSGQLLKDTDFMSMYHSIEIRVPFLSHILVDYVSKINPKLKLKNGIPKYLLRESLKDLLPHSIYKRRKMGFIFPIDKWIRKYNKSIRELMLCSNLLDKNYTLSLFRSFLFGRLHWSKIWALVVFSQWIK
jgi:asparagine synthase (glutamine-hydrolysing)